MRCLKFIVLVTFGLLSLSAFPQGLVPPAQNYQLFFDTNQIIRSEENTALAVETSVTLEAWVRFDSFGSASRFVLGKSFDEFGHDWDYLFRLAEEPGLIEFRVSGGPGQNSLGVDASTALVSGAWTHIAGTYDGADIRIFVNGLVSGSGFGETTQLDRGSPLMIGTAHPDGFRGAVRQVRLWNRALSEEEIAGLAKNIGPQNTTGLLGHWPLDDGRGQVARNLVDGPVLARGIDGTVQENYGNEASWQLTDPFYDIREDLADDIPTGDFGDSIPSFPVVVDLNNDGLDDVLFSSASGIGETPLPIRALLNDGTGAYYDGADEVFDGAVPEALTTFQLVVEDFNGDGLLDLYAGNAGRDDPEQRGEKDFYYLANGSGRWVDSFDSHVRARPCTQANPLFSGQTPCASTPDGGFLYPANADRVEPLVSLNGVAAGDIDNDGDIDLFVAASTDGQLETYDFDLNRPQPYFLTNDGQGNFEADWERIPTEMIHSKSKETNFNEVLLEDLDNDGHLDLLVLGRGETGPCCADRHYADGESYVFWNEGNGDFAESDLFVLPQVETYDNADNRPLTLDIDQDGDKDMLLVRTRSTFLGRYIQVLINQGNRTFVDETAQRFPIQSGDGFPYAHLSAIDLNSDGCMDILNGGQVANISGVEFNPDLFWINDCSGIFKRADSKVFSKPVSLAPVDIHSDDDTDFASYVWNPTFADFSILESVRPFDNSMPVYPSMTIDNGMSGAWYDSSHDGEGWLIEILDENTALVYWFTYPSLGENGQQSWFVGLGEIIANRIIVREFLVTSGATFGPDFDPDRVNREFWGSAEFIFDNCNSGMMVYDGPEGYGSGTLQLSRLSSLQGSECISPGESSTPKSFYAERDNSRVGYFRSGAWYDKSHDGEGWLLEILDDSTALTVWFSYDDLGNQAWMIGMGTISGDRIQFDEMTIPTGTLFGPDFDPESVDRAMWGSITFTFDDCTSGTVSYDSEDERFGSGTLQIEPLTNIKNLNCY